MDKHIKFITLGCKVNQAESESLSAYARTSEKTADILEKSPGICVINTCAVTGKAAMQSRQAIRKAIRSHPGATIIVTGCYAQTAPETISDIEGVDYIVGHSDKHRIFDIIGAHSEKTPSSGIVVNNSIRENTPFSQMPAPAFGCRTRPFLKIQDGCDSFCSYCIVPFSRGKSRSLPPDLVWAELSRLAETGAREIVLTGIHLGRWGKDLGGGYNLLYLLEKLTTHPGIKRLRLSSLEPTEISDALLDFMSESEKICRHLHVPLQSGDAGILKQMNRHYTPEAFAQIIYKIRTRLEDAAIGSDVMAGFPGESQSAFENTYNLIKSLPISYLHVFPFSPRPPAPAAGFDTRVPSADIKKRTGELTALGKLKKAEFYRKMTGKTLEVIIEKKAGKTGFCYKGLSSNYIPVYIEKCGNIDINRFDINGLVSCRVTGSDRDMPVSAVIQN